MRTRVFDECIAPQLAPYFDMRVKDRDGVVWPGYTHREPSRSIVPFKTHRAGGEQFAFFNVGDDGVLEYVEERHHE